MVQPLVRYVNLVWIPSLISVFASSVLLREYFLNKFFIESSHPVTTCCFSVMEVGNRILVRRTFVHYKSRLLLHEQEQIVEYLDEQTSIIDFTITTEEKRIDLLKEYRQSLISRW